MRKEYSLKLKKLKRIPALVLASVTIGVLSALLTDTLKLVTEHYEGQLYERFLRQIFSLRGILRHPETQRIHPAVVSFVKLFKRSDIPFPGRYCQREIGIGRGFRFLCGRQATVQNWEDLSISHVPVLSKRGATENRAKCPLIAKLPREF